MALTIYYTAFHPAYFTRSCEKGPGNGRFSHSIPNGKRGLPLEVVKKSAKRFSGKLPFHLTSNRNFRIFWLNGKHPIILFVCPSKILHKQCFYFLLGLYNGPKRNWKQCLCKILEGQTNSITVFLISANFWTR